MSRAYYSLIALTVVASLSLAIIVIADDSELNKSVFFASEEDKIPVEKLYRISKAFALVLKEFEKVESSILNSSTTPTASPEQIKIITETTSDVDFIYADLDSIRGSSIVKSRRKEVAEQLNALSARIDSLLSVVSK